jgi:hypothetical protein
MRNRKGALPKEARSRPTLAGGRPLDCHCAGDDLSNNINSDRAQLTAVPRPGRLIVAHLGLEIFEVAHG